MSLIFLAICTQLLLGGYSGYFRLIVLRKIGLLFFPDTSMTQQTESLTTAPVLWVEFFPSVLRSKWVKYNFCVNYFFKDKYSF